MAGVLAWEDPPTANDLPDMPEIDHEIAAWQLRRASGRWGVVARVDQSLVGRLISLANAIQRGGPKCYRPSGSFEAVVRQDRIHARLFVRHIGESDTN